MYHYQRSYTDWAEYPTSSYQHYTSNNYTYNYNGGSLLHSNNDFYGYPTNAFNDQDHFEYDNYQSQPNEIFDDFTPYIPPVYTPPPWVKTSEEEDYTDAEIEEFKKEEIDNPYHSLLDNKSNVRNYLMQHLFNAKLISSDKPAKCPRPQNPDGTYTPSCVPVIKKFLSGEMIFRPKLVHKLSSLGDFGPLPQIGNNSPATQSPGTSNLGKRKAFGVNTTAPPKRYANQSAIFVNGKPINTRESNECIAHMKGDCPSGYLCIYEHNGKADHQTTKLCFQHLKGKCRNSKNCSIGAHLKDHQQPVCSYYLRMMCSEDNCSYLHIKHSSNLKNCSQFQKGLCTLGVKCPRPHRYNYQVIDSRCDPEGSVTLEQSSAETEVSAESNSRYFSEPCVDSEAEPLPPLDIEWHF